MSKIKDDPQKMRKRRIIDMELNCHASPIQKNVSLSRTEKFHSDASLEEVDRRALKNSKNGSGRVKVTSACDDRPLLRMVVNDHTASSRQLTVRWSSATDVLMSASSIHRRLLHRGLRTRLTLYRIFLTANHRWLRLQWVHEHKAWQVIWHQVVFSDESRFNLWGHDGRIRVRHYAG
ncbi:transposable element Tcb2 transposase [Trichonephila clavipes]|nr:transposable element Tcb2 transposase [Trichonephila clavipes]